MGPSRPAIIAAWRSRGLPDPVLIGRQSIIAWLHRHGWKRENGMPLTWLQVRALQAEAGAAMYWRPRVGCTKREPTTTHFLMLLWCIEHGT